MSQKEEILLVKELGERIGYGHLMSLASALWRRSLKEKGIPEYGAFIPTVDACLEEEHKLEHDKSSKLYDTIVDNELNR